MPEATKNRGGRSVFEDDTVRNGDPSSLEPEIPRPVPQLDPAPPPRIAQEGIPSTPFAPAYRSTFTLSRAGKKLLPSLEHVNCSYLSTAGFPPTLLQLKQHVHSLTVLIKAITVSTAPGVIDNKNKDQPDLPAFTDSETYDFLNDLRKPYKGPRNEALQQHHSLPLTSLLNTIEEEHIHRGGGNHALIQARQICPLQRMEKIPENGQALPYATHQALIGHANEVLELLDHEYSAKGGVLGILPGEDQEDDRKKAETTLLGQMIVYLQRLVQRLHDLERLYANAMDVLAGEAVTPQQALSKLGVQGRKGRKVVYPQDRFVLVNAGEDVWQFLNREFEKKEVEDALAMSNSRSQGVTGEALWRGQGDQEMSRGIVALDITTRYYRLRGDELKTVFVIPAYEKHPGTKATRDMEKVPTVVSVVKPTWPERASTWEKNNRRDMEDLKRLRQEMVQLKAETNWGRDERKILLFQNETLSGEVRHYREKLKKTENILNEPSNKLKRALLEKANHNLALQEELEDLMEVTQKERETLEEGRREVERAKEEQSRQRLRLAEQHLSQERDYAAKIEDDTRRAEETQKIVYKMKRALETRLVDVAILKHHLDEKHNGSGIEEVSEANKRKGRESAAQIMANILSDMTPGDPSVVELEVS